MKARTWHKWLDGAELAECEQIERDIEGCRAAIADARRDLLRIKERAMKRRQRAGQDDPADG